MIGIRNIQLGYSDGPLDQVCLLDRLKDAGESASKLHGLQDNLPDHGHIHTWHPPVGLCQKVQDYPHPLVLLGKRCNSGQLEFSINDLTAPATGKRILNPSCTRYCNSLRVNYGVLGGHAESWGLFVMARSRALRDKSGPACNVMPLYKFSCIRRASGCLTD